MEGKKKTCGNIYPLAGSKAMSLQHPNSFKLYGTERNWGSYKPTERCSNQSTNSRKEKTCHLCPGIAGAN